MTEPANPAPAPTGGPPTRLRLSRARLIDVAVVIAVACLSLALRARSEDTPFGAWADPWSMLLLVGTTAALLARRDAPVAVWAITLAAAAVDTALSGAPSLVILAVLVTQFTVATLERARVAVLTGTITAVALIAAGADIPQWLTGASYGMVGWAGMATAFGIAVRNQRALLAAAEERARRAELTREEEAQRRVAEERLRIARELHDVVAHHISVINVQSGVARHLMHSRPEEAEAAIGVVRHASQTVMSELGALLGLLRTSEDEAAVQPAPGLDRLDDLVASARHAGLDVALSVRGSTAGLPPIVDLTAYRVAQEALTNAQRHGTGTANLTVERGSSSITIDVSNAVPARPDSDGGAGLGLIGMHERARALGGTVSAGATGDGRFVVHAELPLVSR